MEDRRALLQRLVEFSEPVVDIARALTAFPWDVERPLVTLTRGDVARVLQRYVSGDLSAREVEQWADALEVRDDVQFDDSAEEDVLAAVHLLANPLLHGPLSPAQAEACLRRLGE